MYKKISLLLKIAEETEDLGVLGNIIELFEVLNKRDQADKEISAAIEAAIDKIGLCIKMLSPLLKSRAAEEKDQLFSEEVARVAIESRDVESTIQGLILLEELVKKGQSSDIAKKAVQEGFSVKNLLIVEPAFSLLLALSKHEERI